MVVLQSRFPRLPKPAALSLHRDLMNKGSAMWANGKPKALMTHRLQIEPTTIDKVGFGELTSMREGIMEDLRVGQRSKGQHSSNPGAIDRVVGRKVVDQLDMNAVEASDEGIWAFITLIVLPDLLYERFPNLPTERALGGRRNFVRRNWERQFILGDIFQTTERPLGEDELVGLFERTRLSRNHRLVVAIAEHLTGCGMPNRSKYARRLMAEIGRMSGVLLLDGLDDGGLKSVVQSAGSRVTDRG